MKMVARREALRPERVVRRLARERAKVGRCTYRAFHLVCLTCAIIIITSTRYVSLFLSARKHGGRNGHFAIVATWN